MSKFDRFPPSFHFSHKGIEIEFNNFSRGISFWTDKQKRLMDFIDTIYIPLHIEGTNEHDFIYSHAVIKKIASGYAERHFLN